MLQKFLFPLHETPGDPTGGGSGPADASLGGAAPITISDDALFIPPGGKDPVKWKDYSSGFVPKSDLTRMRQQDAATLRQQQDALKAQEAQLTRAAQQLTQRLGPQTGQADPLAELRNAPYVDGKAVAGLVEAMRSELAKRDQALNLMHQQMQQMNQGFSTLQGRTRQADTQALFDQTRSTLGLPDNPQVRALIESEYHAHDGWDTVSVDDRLAYLGQVVKQRYDGLMALFKTDQQKRVDDARLQRLKPPAPTIDPKARLAGKKVGGKSAEDLANELWPLVQSSPQT